MMGPLVRAGVGIAFFVFGPAVTGCADDDPAMPDGGVPPDDAGPPDELELPGATFYPESLTAAADGTLYVGSAGTGQIVRFAPGSSAAETLVAASPRGVTGVFAVESENILYACSVELASLLAGTPASEVREYDLTTGELRASFPLETPAFCNDFAIDASGAVYVTDSFVKVYRRAAGSQGFDVWTTEPLLAPSMPTGFGGDGIVVDGQDMYVNTFTDGKLVRIPIQDDGAAGPGVALTLDRALAGPDAMRTVGAGELIVVNGVSGELVRLAVNGTGVSTTVVAADLNQPTSVAVTDDSYWVTEGQIGYLLGSVGGEPSLPFTVVRLDR